MSPRNLHPPLAVSLTRSLAAAALLLAPAIGHAQDDSPEAVRRRALRRTPVVEAVEKAAPSVVSIGTTQLVRVRRFWEWEFLVQERPGALGSGVIVHPDGYVITNAHVINQAEQIAVKLTGLGDDDTEIAATLIDVDLEHDLALIKMDTPGPYPAARFGRTDDLMVGETVIAMGSPFGLGRTVTTGVVSALSRDIHIRDQLFEGMIQADALVNQGNSGGALLNILGEWIGVNSAIYSLSGGSDGISFAIPIETARAFVVRAMRPRNIANRWLGLEFGEHANGRVFVSKVYPVGPANGKGAHEGALVLGPDGKPLTDLIALTFAVLAAADEGAFEFRVRGDREIRTVRIPFTPLPTEKLSWLRVGVRVAEVTPKITEKTNFREGAGVMVLDVRKDGPAQRVGVRPGDLLIGIGGTPIRSLEHVLVTLQGAGAGDLLDVRMIRRNQTRFGVSFEPWKATLAAD